MKEKLLDYFNGDDLAADVWQSKYQVKDPHGVALEETPDDMHSRLAKQFAVIEDNNYIEDVKNIGDKWSDLSEMGFNIYKNGLSEKEIFEYFKNFKYIIPQGSIMSILGHPYKVGSLSNCFVIPSPYDSYGGIMKTDQQMVQLMKRRGGVGTNLNKLRPNKSIVRNSAGTSTGAVSFMERYSNSTREVAQDGRRGALMLLMSCLHPDIFDFVKIKKDRTKVTGANVSTMLTDDFMNAAENDLQFICRFPIDYELDVKDLILSEWIAVGDFYKMWEYKKGVFLYKIKAKELFDLIIEMAWENAEPGLAFYDRVLDFSPDGVYEVFKAIASNPCGEQWLPPYDSCRLFALNLLSIILNPFTKDSKIDFDKLYEIAYMQQRLADDLVELELIHVQRIINKIKNDPEPEDVKQTELDLWENVYKIAKAGRRTGCGFTALGDMLAAMGVKYDSKEALEIVEKVMRVKMQAELDCTIDLAILRGTFEGWDPELEKI